MQMVGIWPPNPMLQVARILIKCQITVKAVTIKFQRKMAQMHVPSTIFIGVL